MISEGSCDTGEDWSKDAENSALITGINYILKSIQIEKLFQIVMIDLFIFLIATDLTVICIK